MELRVPADVRHVRRARQWVMAHAGARGLAAPALRVVELLTSELVTNAVKYGGGDEVLVRVTPAAGGVRVEVHDECPLTPQVLDPEDAAPGGRGMRLVNLLADQWGVDRREPAGKAVWFAVPRSGRRRHGRGVADELAAAPA
ncbi:ATP-binding protein [Actinotalea solisilvae]|uniref:ATP-binding protein n=1 Tax=Actinotalea solisilvae TaxID=2072922 RepID=UPI0018F114AB|nr:ATP-binding protein [Actinotalea solisilvae]